MPCPLVSKQLNRVHDSVVIVCALMRCKRKTRLNTVIIHARFPLCCENQIQPHLQFSRYDTNPIQINTK